MDPFSRPLHGLSSLWDLTPALKRWAIIIRPLRGLPADCSCRLRLTAPAVCL